MVNCNFRKDFKQKLCDLSYQSDPQAILCISSHTCHFACAIHQSQGPGQSVYTSLQCMDMSTAPKALLCIVYSAVKLHVVGSSLYSYVPLRRALIAARKFHAVLPTHVKMSRHEPGMANTVRRKTWIFRVSSMRQPQLLCTAAALVHKTEAWIIHGELHGHLCEKLWNRTVSLVLGKI